MREYALTVDPALLVAHRLELSTVEQAVREANIVGAAGLVRDGYQLTMTVVRGGGTTLDDLLDVAVPVEGTTPVPAARHRPRRGERCRKTSPAPRRTARRPCC